MTERQGKPSELETNKVDSARKNPVLKAAYNVGRYLTYVIGVAAATLLTYSLSCCANPKYSEPKPAQPTTQQGIPPGYKFTSRPVDPNRLDPNRNIYDHGSVIPK